MLGISYLKTSPTTYVIQFVGGKPVRQGPGLSFFFFAPHSVIVLVPLSSVDVPFVFNEITADFQEVTIQGQLTYRVRDAKLVSQVLDYSVASNGRYLSEDPRKLGERMVTLTQVLTSGIINRRKLRDALAAKEVIVSEVLEGLRQSQIVTMLGVEVLGLSITSIKPSPDTGKALEAEAREALLRLADEAVYARRNAAVAQEQLIKESELNSERVVEEKKRLVREAKMEADIAAEKQRAQLLAERVDNERKEADSRAYALSTVLAPVRDLDWRILTSLSAGKLDSKLSIAMAFRDLAEQAGKIGQLNISPDLLTALLDEKKK